jgi:hypothetical protein
MKSKKIIIIVLAILILNLPAYSQNNLKSSNFIPKVFWNKFSLPTVSECKIRITPYDISPDEEYCRFLGHLSKGTKITMKKMFQERGWTKLILQAEEFEDDFEVFLKGSTKANLKKSFDLAFSSKEIKDDSNFCDCHQKTKLDLIKCKGFPDSITRTKEEEIFHFGYGFIGGQCGGFDISTVRIKKGKIINVGGII